jgi:hypothetical protein
MTRSAQAADGHKTQDASKAEMRIEPSCPFILGMHRQRAADVISVRVVDSSGWIEAFQWVLHEHGGGSAADSGQHHQAQRSLRHR